MRSTGVHQHRTTAIDDARARAIRDGRRYRVIRGYRGRAPAPATDVLHAWVGAVDIGLDRVARFARALESLPRETPEAPVAASALFALLAARGREVVQTLDRQTSNGTPRA